MMVNQLVDKPSPQLTLFRANNAQKVVFQEKRSAWTEREQELVKREGDWLGGWWGAHTDPPPRQALQCRRALPPRGATGLTTCGRPGLLGPTTYKRGAAR